MNALIHATSEWLRPSNSGYDLAAPPRDSVQVGDDAFHVEPTAVRFDSFADGSALVVDTRKAERQMTGPPW
jgi:hypothetical protein